MLYDAEQSYLDAKQRYEWYRDSYIPYEDDKEKYKTELELLIGAMDVAENYLRIIREEYGEVIERRRAITRRWFFSLIRFFETFYLNY